MSLGTYDIWGYGPFVSRRYAEFMAHTQGEHPDAVVLDIPFEKLHPLYIMLRCKYYLTHEGGRLLQRARSPGYEEVVLVPEYEVIRDRDDIFAAMSEPDFDPSERVILEEEPRPVPAQDARQGTARVMERGTDHLVIEAETLSPALLLVTDAYADGWKAHPLKGSSQERYQVLPANYVLRGVPLEAGSHRILMTYRPRGLIAGLIVSLVSLALLAGATGLLLVRKRQR